MDAYLERIARSCEETARLLEVSLRACVCHGTGTLGPSDDAFVCGYCSDIRSLIQKRRESARCLREPEAQSVKASSSPLSR